MQEFTDDDELRAGSSLDGYRLQQRIGRGGYGEVWRVHDAFGSPCALKMIRATPGQRTSRARLRREYEGVRNLKAARMTDTAIVQIWHANQAHDSSSFWYVMELADASPSTEAHYQAETLAEKINRELRIELREILRIVRPLADALVRLHARGLIHRDIKPSNILFIQGQAKLGDCGLVSLSRDSITHVGTPNYMPRHCGPGTHADVFALATVCWEMMMGYPPTDAQEPEVADADTDLQHLMTIVAKYRSEEALGIEEPAQQFLDDLIQLENELRRQGDQHGTC
jgi:serine/threonine protein kinase